MQTHMADSYSQEKSRFRAAVPRVVLHPLGEGRDYSTHGPVDLATSSGSLSYPSSAHSVDEKIPSSVRGTCHCSPVPGTVVRCIAPYGVAIRSGPDFSEKTVGFVRSGDTICIAECHGDTNWIREMDGWIPLRDPRSHPLFEVDVYA